MPVKPVDRATAWAYLRVVAALIGQAPPSLGRLRQALADARAAGATFDEAWTAATAGYPERDVLDDTRDAWQRAYGRMPPTEGDRAAARLAALVDGVGEVAPATPQTSGGVVAAR